MMSKRIRQILETLDSAVSEAIDMLEAEENNNPTDEDSLLDVSDFIYELEAIRGVINEDD